ncbi:MAG: arginine repressor [Thermaerobacter sp.]|jgi:transcriptional regulator of arginine metabolism|nr:arginine repressor [Thermaerobacter sp.]
MKALRHMKILDLIDRDIIETQEDLTARLGEEGVKVTQATVSRDIKELGLVKAAVGDGRNRYAPPEEPGPEAAERLLRIFRECMVRVESSGNLLVVSTLTATADAVCEAIDGLGWREIIGTMAGERTVFLVVKPPEAAEEVRRRLEGLLA